MSNYELSFHTTLFYGNRKSRILTLKDGTALSTQHCSTETHLTGLWLDYDEDGFPHNTVLRKLALNDVVVCLDDALSTQHCSTETLLI